MTDSRKRPISICQFAFSTDLFVCNSKTASISFFSGILLFHVILQD